ncbi:Polyketide cyclase / dehydrase and lipid transport [Nocardia amikacinitolerans]|uniref:hemerythrin domain-containing protein n=1 Tax=Nocardia amikacinitolerans TaxID=756689 RepID=UPI00082E3696|nr:hemerythrin domain-containing protein [Nocardia amikacinitolerans]MCP2315027.1 Polyketide cyclase / dehydrase and lipid transport [Nocardia amikacinitolerans]
MASSADLERPADTRVMGIVNSAMRRDLRRARNALSAWPYPYDEQRVAIAEHLLWIMRFLHHHHESEDEHLYPVVRDRDPAAARLLDRMNADHRAIEPAIDRLVRAASVYRVSAEARADVLAALDHLEAVLLPHLEREEREMMPVVSATMTEGEWRHWADEYNVKPLGPIELFDEGLFLVDGASPGDAAAIGELVPAVPRWLMLRVMIKRYRKAAFRRWHTDEFSPLRTPLGGSHEAFCAERPEAVWAVLTDITRVGEWSHECRGADWVGDSTRVEVGARFRGRSKSGFLRWRRICTVTVADAPKELVWVTHGGIFGDHTEWRFLLRPTPDGTRIRQTYRVLALPVWFDRMIYRFLPAHRDRSRALQGDLDRLAQLVERESS